MGIGNEFVLRTSSFRPRKARSANFTAATYPARPNTLTKPSGDGVITALSIPDQGMPADPKIPNYLKIWPYGTGGTSNTFNIKILGWDFIPVTKGSVQVSGGANPSAQEWFATALVEFTAVTTFNSPGVGAGGVLLTTEFFCNAATIANGCNIGVDTILTSPSTDKLMIKQDIAGFPLIEILFACTGGSAATGANALCSFF